MSDRIQELVDKTFTLSKDYKHHYVTIEHLLAIILDTDEVQDILAEMQIDPKDCSRDVYDHLEKEVDAYTDEDIQVNFHLNSNLPEYLENDNRLIMKSKRYVSVKDKIPYATDWYRFFISTAWNDFWKAKIYEV